jgi:hypothetical protein
MEMDDTSITHYGRYIINKINLPTEVIDGTLPTLIDERSYQRYVYHEMIQGVLPIPPYPEQRTA